MFPLHRFSLVLLYLSMHSTSITVNFMETSLPPAILTWSRSSPENFFTAGVTLNPNFNSSPNLNLLLASNKINSSSKLRIINGSRIRAIGELGSATADPAQVELSWEIVVGALAGVTPFVVAGVEFSKRIVAQQRCGVCKGSGLVLRDKYYFRCPRCGGFLPWQSWKKFFGVK